MASIQTGSGRRGRKGLDIEIPLIPFIDLLLCCVMFLLATAVWNQLARVTVTQHGASDTPADVVLDEPLVRLTLQVTSASFVLSSTLGDRIEVPREDLDALAEALATANRMGAPPALTIAPDDDITHGEVIRAMDLALASGFHAIDLS